jgi:hypothetical protein
MHSATIKIYILSPVSVATLSIQHNKCRMTNRRMDRPKSMMTEQAWNGLKPTADDYNILNEADAAVMLTL